MAIAHQNTTSATGSIDADPSWAHDAGSGADRFLAIWGKVTFGGGPPNEAITGATYNAVPLAEFGAILNTEMKGFYLVAPATGSNTAVVTFTGNSGRPTIGVASSYNGVDQSTPYDGYNTATGSSDTPSVDITSATGEMVVAAAGSAAVRTSTVGADQDERNITSVTARTITVSDQAGAATVTMSNTWSSSTGWETMGISMNPAAAAGLGIPIASYHYRHHIGA